MPGIEVNCGSCGAVFEVAEDRAGMLATCPECGRKISVPYPEDDLVERPRLQVKKDTTITGSKRCPACGGTMAADAVICLQCGYDTRTGLAHGTSTGMAVKAKSILFILLLILLLSVAWLAWRHFYGGSGPIGELPSISNPSVASAVSESPSEQESGPLDEATALLNEPTGETDAEKAEAMEIPAVEEESAAGGAEEKSDITSVLARDRVWLKAQLDKKYPLYKIGTEVELRRSNGLINRGLLTQVGRTSVMLQVGEQWTEVPFNVLDRTTRLHCDKKFRDKFVEYKLRQRQKQLESR